MCKRALPIAVVFMLGFLWLGAAQSQAAVIYNTFGPGDLYDPTTGWTISNSNTIGYFEQGDAFTPTSSYTLTSLELAFWVIDPGNSSSLDLWLMSDASGAPGSIIESFAMPLPNNVGIVSANSVSNPLLSAGQQYWLVASTPVLGTWMAWSISPAAPALHAKRDAPDGDWLTQIDEPGAFRLYGDPYNGGGGGTVPEPASMLLLGSGVACLAAWRRKRKIV